MRSIFAITLTALVGSSCQSPQSDPIAAEFRWAARKMYASLLTPSCEAPAGFDRTSKVKQEVQAVEAVEREMKGMTAQFHLQIARADTVFHINIFDSCWANSSWTFANLHVASTKRTVRDTLKGLRAIAPSVNRRSPSEIMPEKNATEFRYLVRRLIEYSRRRCKITMAADNDEVLGSARREIDRFRDGLTGSPYADHFDIAEADAAYEFSVTSVECATPSQTHPAILEREASADVARQLASIGQLVRSH